ncbi:MAG: hypothetical protein L0Z62_22075, partial [Gemmataceae bacterium]|nr:hypothetical protein [Gemmataceae bacterium]
GPRLGLDGAYLLGRGCFFYGNAFGSLLVGQVEGDFLQASATNPNPPQAEDLRTWALRIGARRGKQVAVVALARRLAGILYARLRDGSVFEPQRSRHPRPTPAAAALVGT